MGYEKLKLAKVEKILRSLFKNYGSDGLDFEYEYDDDCVTAQCHLSLKSHDDDILASFNFYTGGNAGLDFFFDHLDLNEQTLRLINDFNDNVYYLKAHISEKGFLVISAPVEYLTLDTLDEYVGRVMNDLADDKAKTYLLPLTRLTY